MENEPAAREPAAIASAALPPALRRELRARAHHLHPVVAIGQHGLTPRVLHELDVALTAHGLVKLRVFAGDRALREALLARICAALGCAPVQHLGKLLILWRPCEEARAPAKAVAAKRARPSPVGAKPTAPKPTAARDRRAAARAASDPAQQRRTHGASAPRGVPRAAMPRRRRGAARA